MSKRRLALIAIAVALLAMVLVPDAMAAAGGGSGGFGGGGGEGGGGGRGAGLYIIIQLLIRIALIGHGTGLLILLGLLVLWILFTNVAPRAKAAAGAQASMGRAARRRTAHRERRVELAAAEAADEDPAFAPDVVKAAATELFIEIQKAWTAKDAARLRSLVGPDLMKEWDRRLKNFDRRGWHNYVEPVGDPKVEYVGLVNRGDPTQDRVTVRMEGKLRDYVEDRFGNRIKRAGRLGETVRVREFWTLGRSKGEKPWRLMSIEQGAEGAHALEEQIVATPWSDDQGLRDQALVEGAVADAVPDGVKIAELADLDYAGDARAAALDLSLADARFGPDVLEVAARQAVAAWADAVDGDDAKLRSVAHSRAVRDLLHPGDPSERTRLVVRGPQVKRITIEHLDASEDPPTMRIGVQITGRRYIEDRDTTTLVAGNQNRETAFVEHWTLALDGDQRQPWRIAAT